MSRWQSVGMFIVKERLWFYLGLLYLIAWIIPFSWMADWWQVNYTPVAAQPFVLPGFLFALWGRQRAFKDFLNSRSQMEYHTRKVSRNGSLTILCVGCCLYFFAHFSRLAVAGILGLVLILLGSIVCVYGKSVFSVLKAPIVYLLMIVPWLPESAIAAVQSIGLRLHSILIYNLLLRLGHQVIINPEMIMIDGASLPTPFTLNGMQGEFAAVVFFWAYGLYKRFSSQRIIGQVCLGLTVVFVVHQIRFAMICLAIISNPLQANKLTGINTWLFTIPSLAVTFGVLYLLARIRRPAWLSGFFRSLSRLSKAIQRPIDSVVFGTARAGTKVGKGFLIVFTPLIWIANVFVSGLVKMGTLFGSSSKELESLIRRGERFLNKRRKR